MVCASSFVASRYLSLYNECPTDSYANASLLAVNDDDEYCRDTYAGASTLSHTVPLVLGDDEANTVYLALEQFAADQSTLWDPEREYYYELTLTCDAGPTPEPTPEPTPHDCQHIPVECGDVIIGYLGHYDNITGTNLTYPTERLIYGFTADFNQTEFPWDLFNATVKVSTCR